MNDGFNISDVFTIVYSILQLSTVFLQWKTFIINERIMKLLDHYLKTKQ